MRRLELFKLLVFISITKQIVLSFTSPSTRTVISHAGFSSFRSYPIQQRIVVPSSPADQLTLNPILKSFAVNPISPTIDNVREPLFEGMGKGVFRDYKERLPIYWSDIKDGLNVQVRKVSSRNHNRTRLSISHSLHLIYSVLQRLYSYSSRAWLLQ
jgi:hypothetical protein